MSESVQYAKREDVRDRIYRNSLSFVWLIARLREKGIVVTKSQLSGMLAGTRLGQKTDTVIEESLSILSEYESRMQSKPQ